MKNDWVQPFAWSLYSKKMKKKILDPRSAGSFKLKDKEISGMHLAKGEAGSRSQGNYLIFFLLVDEKDGVVVDAKYQLFGDSCLIAVAEVVAELVVGKNYAQVGRFGAELIEKSLSDEKSSALSIATHVNLVLEALDEAVAECSSIPLEQAETPFASSEEGVIYEGWLELKKEQKLLLIEQVLDEKVRPYIELDAGGVKVIDLVKEQLMISYEGNCTSCYSSVGSTLFSIQDVLQKSLHPTIVVVPNLDELAFS